MTNGMLSGAEGLSEVERSQTVKEKAGERPFEKGLNPSDSVSVSQDARLLSEAAKAAQTAPDVRSERVEQLRIQVQNGTYKPDSAMIAANLIREEPGLFI
ncbi:MAG: flagellar biosynthesis anti-sigma factor FlgM [Desulfovibrio sp.]|nr:flagellar biosynthesis anti-sigma factor FlgM [Desulfovibrio sp.]